MPGCSHGGPCAGQAQARAKHPLPGTAPRDNRRMQADRPAAPDGPAPDGPAPDGPAPDGPAPDRSGLTDRQRHALASLGDRLARLPDSHPSAPRYEQERKKLLNDSPVADGAPGGGAAPVADAREARGGRAGAAPRAGGREPRGERAGAADGRSAEGAAGGFVPGMGGHQAGERNAFGGRLAKSLAFREAARGGRAAAPRQSAGRDAPGRAGTGGQAADRAGWLAAPGGAGRRDAYRPWFYGSGEPWFSADWTGAGTGWFGATPGRSS
jgi:hypothetical protein